MEKIKAFVRWLLSSVWRAPAVEENTQPASLVPVETPTPTAPGAPKRRAVRPEEHFGARYYLGDLLDQLDTCFADITYLKRGEPEIGGVIERLGCTILDDKMLLSVDLEPIFFARMPSVGCSYFGRRDTDKTLCLRFLYFQKHHQPINVQPTNGVIYVVGGVYGIKHPHLLKFHVAVFPDGSMKILKELSARRHVVGKNRSRSETIVRMEWSYPPILEEMRRDYNKRYSKNETTDDYVRALVTSVFNAALTSEAGMNVRVRKGGRVASFAIDMLRAPYFFADREKATVNGKREKILHIVRPHVRTGRDGAQKIVKAHWRGARRFRWNDYDVTIGMPGKHLPSLMLDLTASSWEQVDADREGVRGLPLEEVSGRIAEAIQ